MLRHAFLVAVCCSALTSAEPAASWERDIRPLLASTCFECHGAKKAKGGIDLERFATVPEIQFASGQWENVIRVISSREMPPAKATRQPSDDDRDRVMAWVRHTLDHVDESLIPKDPGHVVPRRLNRHEYNHTVRDLLGIDTRPADRFPLDGGGGAGFDNNADTLFTPPLLVEMLMDVAEEMIAGAKPEALPIVAPGADVPKERRLAAKSTFAAFMARAWRRPVSGGEVDRLVRLWEDYDKKGVAYDVAVRHALKAVLCSPHFLYRLEQSKAGDQPWQIGQYEMASRLSYFLWSSMPDQELIDLAAAGKLHDVAVIERQVLRLIADPRADALASRFTTQWLQIDRLADQGPDPSRFPNWTPALRDALIAEPIALFRDLARGGGSVMEFVSSDAAMLNAELALHYGVHGVDGDELRRVAITDANRGGVLGMGAVLAATSFPLRTSPVLRGKWVLEVLLDEPPPPPPPNIAQLPKDESAQQEASLREKLEAHRADARCASCHRRIDPVGFGLENFDVTGRWRDRDPAGRAIDASGALPSGEAFVGPAELKRTLVARSDRFKRVLAGKLLGYAIGRGLNLTDRPALTAIVAATDARQSSLSAMIVAVCQSYPFRYARNANATPRSAP